MKLFKIILFFSLLIFSCSEEKKQEKQDITGNWKTKLSIDNRLYEYLELFVDDKNMYVFSDAGLIYVKELNANDKSLEITKKESDLIITNLSDSTRVIYSEIKKGILPKVCIDNMALEDCFYKSFFNRQKIFLENIDKLENGILDN